MRILLIEDDKIIGESLKQILEFNNFVVDWFEDGESCLLALCNHLFNIIILDLNLPDINAKHIIQDIRHKRSTIPIIVISANNSVENRVLSLDLGADDFLSKPFDSKELIARIKSLHRRNLGLVDNIIFANDILINTDKKQVFFGEKLIELTPKEYMILKNLVENNNKPISKNNLENLLYNFDNEIESNALEVHIHNIRKKTNNSTIKTIRGFGYKL